MKFFRIPAWLIGGFLGLIYFSITYFIDIGQCQFYGDVAHCSGTAGLVFMILNFPSSIVLHIIYPVIYPVIRSLLDFSHYSYFMGIAILDFIFGSIVGYLAGLLVYFIKKQFKV